MVTLLCKSKKKNEVFVVGLLLILFLLRCLCICAQ